MPPREVPRAPAPETTRSLLVCGLLGVGIMAAIDEIVFHQILAWHHFYDRSTGDVALLSDGLLHAGELIAIVASLFMYADMRRRQALDDRYGWAGFLLGLGGFQVCDGIVDHKVLRVHQVRYVENLLPYDIAWNAFGLLLLLGGLLLYRVGSARREPADA